MWQKVCLVALGGAAGAIARYGLSMGLKRVGGLEPAWGTFAVNALGCLAFGVIATLITRRSAHAELLSALILVGFMGSFTTFSSFAFHTVELANKNWTSAAVNLLGQNIVGLLLILLGTRLGGWLAGPAS